MVRNLARPIQGKDLRLWIRLIWPVTLLFFGFALLSGDQEANKVHHPTEDLTGYISRLEDPSRREWQKPDVVVQKLNLRAGQSVADLGAGSGYFTVRLAGAVGELGKVYAVDIEPALLDHVVKRIQELGMGNIEMVLAAPDDPKLPEASVDLIFTCNVLHHVENRDRYYRLLQHTLKSGGRFAVLDFYKRPLPVGPPPAMKIRKEDMIREVEAAGFRLDQDFAFLPHQYFLVFKLK